MQKIVITLSGSPYGTEHMFNALRMALALKDQDEQEVELKLFLMSDSVYGAIKGQSTPDFSYNIVQMLEILAEQNVEIQLCKTCVEARGLTSTQFIDAAEVGTMPGLTSWILAADKVIAA